MRVPPPIQYSLLDIARAFMLAAHVGIEQKRKYTGEDYSVHPEETLQLLLTYAEPTLEMQCAMLLHDILEDTGVKRNHLALVFGQAITELVEQLSDISKPTDGNRAVRKRIDRDHLLEASVEGMLMKCADFISNTKSIAKYDPKFAKTYVVEVFEVLLGFKLHIGHTLIHRVAVDQLFDAMKAVLPATKVTAMMERYTYHNTDVFQ